MVSPEICDALRNAVARGNLCRGSVSGPISKQAEYFKIGISLKRTGKSGVFYQLSMYYGTQVRHENLHTPEELTDKLLGFLAQGYKTMQLMFENDSITILTSKKLKMTMLRGKADGNAKTAAEEHNTEKNYILKENIPVPWLVKLDVMDTEGRVLSPMRKKFRQINKFLEIVSGVCQRLPDNPTIVDFGCGKSYLTFALYDYLCSLNKAPQIIGLDLKADVIESCNALAKELGFTGLNFHVGDVGEFFENNPRASADMLVTLHACNTATDYALYYGLRWQCKIILSVPCCQHQLFPQVKNDGLAPLLRHGILKERFAALLTDAVRAAILEAFGYKTTVMEFIDMEHTPKNIMLRAVRSRGTVQNHKLDEVRALMNEYHITPMFYELVLPLLNTSSEGGERVLE